MLGKNQSQTDSRIDESIDSLLNDFLTSAMDLFRQNQKYIKEFEGGRYSCAYLNPSRRLRQTMAVDREVLIVASTFTDQQQRTIKFIQSEIANSNGRLEPTLAIIVHVDPNGNSNLEIGGGI